MTPHPSRGTASLWLPASVVWLCFLNPANAANANRFTPLYAHDRWEAEQGFPGGAVNALTQTSDGYLWIGADNGLVRFDGLNFRLFNHSNSPEMPPGPVLGLAAGADGDLWIRMQNPSLLHYQNGEFHDVLPADLKDHHPITALTRGGNGEILATVVVNHLLKFKDQKLVRREFQADVPGFLVISIAETPDGTVWMGMREKGLFSLSKNDNAVVPRGLGNASITHLLPAGDRELWIGTDTGVVRWDGSELTRSGVDAQLSHSPVLAMTRDRKSNLWVANSEGLWRSGGQGDVTCEEPAEADSAPITSLFEDREGNIWTGDAAGIARLRPTAFVTYATSGTPRPANDGALYSGAGDRLWFGPSNGGLFYLQQGRIERVSMAGLDQDVVYSISGGGDEVWLGRQHGGLTRLRTVDRSFTADTYARAQGLPQDSVYTVYRSRDGAVWAGTLSGGAARFQNGHFTTYTASNGLASDHISAILETSDGTTWFATPNGLSAFSNGQWRNYAGREGLPPGAVNCLLEDSAGVLWLGTSEGPAFLQSGRIRIPPQLSDALREEVLGMAEDADGWLWIATSAHVLQVKRDKLREGSLNGDIREYGIPDGLLGTAGVRRDRSVVADGGGRIWFSLNRGISVVDPARVSRQSVPAIVTIQAISGDGSPLGLRGDLHIPADTRRIVFSYAGLSLSTPERVKYRYMLDGFDHGWSEPSGTREAFYTNLGPGSYRFHVMASNGAGLWNGAEATAALEVDPLFWQTWWFYACAALACWLAVFSAFRSRMSRLTRQLNMRFEERLAERTRIAQELHDTLLQGVLSVSMRLHIVVDGLPEGSPAKPLLDSILDLMKRVIDEGRNTLQGLRSSYGRGTDLEQSFSSIRGELFGGGEMDFRIIVEGQPRTLHPVLRDEVYRIGREALVNAFRHSRATKIEIELEYAPRELRVLVRDNGCGIDPQTLRSGTFGHWGLSGMRERAESIGARFHVWSSAVVGTEVQLSVPGHIAFQSQPSNRRSRWFARKRGERTETTHER